MFHQIAPRPRQNIRSDPVRVDSGVEHLQREGGDVRFACVLHPADQVIRFIQLQCPQNSLAKRSPLVITIVVINDRLERPEANLIAAAFIGKEMPPAADLGRLARRGASEATGTGAAEDEDAWESVERGAWNVTSDLCPPTSVLCPLSSVFRPPPLR